MRLAVFGEPLDLFFRHLAAAAGALIVGRALRPNHARKSIHARLRIRQRIDRTVRACTILARRPSRRSRNKARRRQTSRRPSRRPQIDARCAQRLVRVLRHRRRNERRQRERERCASHCADTEGTHACCFRIHHFATCPARHARSAISLMWASNEQNQVLSERSAIFNSRQNGQNHALASRPRPTRMTSGPPIFRLPA